MLYYVGIGRALGPLSYVMLCYASHRYNARVLGRSTNMRKHRLQTSKVMPQAVANARGLRTTAHTNERECLVALEVALVSRPE